MARIDKERARAAHPRMPRLICGRRTQIALNLYKYINIFEQTLAPAEIHLFIYHASADSWYGDIERQEYGNTIAVGYAALSAAA